jgi:tripartite-type tricarboxylate transporter receptor subunit TctC
MKRREVFRLAAMGAVAGAFLSRNAAAQAYPNRPVRVIVPYAPGGVVDVVARQWAERAKGTLGSIVVENQGGGGGTIGAANVMRSAPDGYTLLFGDTSTQVIAPAIMAAPPYDPAVSFIPVAMVATSSTAVVVHPSVPAKTLAEFVDYARSKGKELSYGSAGTGTVTHLAGELFKQLVKAPDIVHVPYRGAGPGITDLLAGTIPFMTPNVTGQVLDFHRAGKLRILAICSPSPMKAAPELPVASATLPGLVVQLSSGVFAPANTQADVLDTVAKATAGVVSDAGFATVMEAAGLDTRTETTPAAAAAYVNGERQRLLPVIQAAGIKT